MNTPTREQVAQWSNDCGTHERPYPGFTDGLIKLITLARADLEATIESLRQQLAESQAREAKRITAMQAAWNNEYCSFGPEGLTEAQKQFSSALALPNDATALNELIAERTKELTAELEETRLQMITDFGQYQEAHEKVKELTAEVERLRHTCGIEHDTANAHIMDAASLRWKNAELTAQIEAAQAKIDSLMLEYCPDEMTPEQKKVWADNQVKDGE